MILVPIAGIGGFALLANERAAFASLEATSAAQIANEKALLLVVDEETGLRGYGETHQKVFLEPYRRALRREGVAFAELRRRVGYFNDPQLNALVEQMLAAHARWNEKVTQPIVRKGYIDQIRAYSAELERALAARYGQAERRGARGFALVGIATLTALGAATALILGFALRQYRVRAERQREQATINALQRVFVNRWQALPNTMVGTAYLSATREAAVGGDLFNVRRMGPERGLILIGDIAGKGIDAAVDTAYVRFAIATLAEIFEDPGEVVRRFNVQYANAIGNRDAFVVAFLAVVDLRSMRMAYASAGHPSAWLVRRGAVDQLRVTGPVLGVMQDALYETESIELMPGDTLVLTTDGLTEARNKNREPVGLETSAKWIAEVGSLEPQAMIDTLVARLRAYAGGEIGDDLAMVAVRFEGTMR